MPTEQHINAELLSEKILFTLGMFTLEILLFTKAKSNH